MYSVVEVSSYAFVASRVQSLILQDHILRDSGVSGMDSDFDRALSGLRAIIHGFDLSGFVNKNTIPPKVKHALTSALFSNIVQEME